MVLAAPGSLLSPPPSSFPPEDPSPVLLRPRSTGVSTGVTKYRLDEVPASPLSCGGAGHESGGAGLDEEPTKYRRDEVPAPSHSPGALASGAAPTKYRRDEVPA
jgi:hypothetical protein